MTELGVGYLSIVADTSRLPGQINSALNGAQSSANSAGESMGSRLASGISKTLKVGVAAAGVAAGGLLASSIHKGLGRLSAIDDAQGKLTSLGNSTAATAKIMDSALAAVKGTSYGLGDAATIAASAVAAGVKPGQDLTRYLGLTADAASIAGVSLSEMGQIINKVQTSGTAYTMEITQLADRGLPIWQWLATEMKKPQAEMKKLVAEGKVDSATYLRAIENNIGGAATAATTVSSAWANLGAAQGRFGATVAGPIFRQAIPAFLGLTKAVDELDAKAKPVMATFEKNLTGKYIPAMLEFGNQGKAAFEKFRNSDLAVQSMSQIGNVVDRLVETGKAVGPSLGTIGTSLSKASAALGVSTWGIFLNTLDASAQILNSTLVPVLNVTAGLMENNQGAVVGLAAAFLAFKTIPALLGRVSAATTPIGTAATSAAGGLRGFTTAARGVVTASGGIASAGSFGTVQMGRFGSSISALGQHVPGVYRMQDAFVSAAVGASRFSRTAGTISAVTTGVKSGVSNLAGALGGPLNIALMMAAAGFMSYQSSVSKANNQQRILADSISTTSERQADMLKLLVEGDQTAIGAKAVENMKSLRQEQQSLADTGPGWMHKAIAAFDDWGSAIGVTRGETMNAVLSQRDLADESKAVTATLDKLKITNEDLGRAVSGSEGAFGSLRNKLVNNGGEEAVEWLDKQRAEYRLLKMAMEDVGPAGIQIADAIGAIADSAGDSKSKLEGMQTVLRALGILETDTQAALFETAEAVRELAAAAEKGADPVGGLGKALIGLDGNLNPDMPNAKALRDSLVDLGGDFKNLVASGMSSKDAYAEIEAGLLALSDTYDLPIEKVRKFAEAQGMVVDQRIDFAMSVQGRDEAAEAIATVATRAKELEGGKTISMIVEDQAAIDALTGLGLQVLKINETTGEIDVTANSDAALAGIGAVTLALGQLDEGVATPEITADTTRFAVANQETRDKLGEIDRTTVSPQIGALLDKFMEGRNVTLAELQKIDLSTAEPDVQLLIKDAIANAVVVNKAIDEAARPRTANIQVTWSGDLEAARRASMPQNWQGPVSGLSVGGAYAGMRVPGYAGGGKLPTTGPGTDTVDGILGVDSNGIPTARVNRGEWVINDHSSEKYHRELAAINAGTFPKLPGYVDGGRVGSGDLLDFVNGRAGGAKPLTGSPYDFGGVHWGDCSGAMSAIARFAVGLAPFAARFATGNMASALSAMGFLMGRGGPGDLRFGWYNGGPYGGHTAGTLPDGTNVEMGGGYGGGMVGGNVGSDASSFTDHAYLPIGSGFDWNQSGVSTQRGRGRVSRGGSQKQPEWTAKQQLDLENAEIAVRLAEEARTDVEAAMAKGTKSQNDLDAANKKIEIAQQKVVDLQKKKDDVASWVADGPAPQAPTLSRMFTDAEVDRIDAQLAVDAANDRRNEVYDDPYSTDTELDKADAELFKAQKALRELGMSKSGDTPTSWSGIAGDFAKAAASGFVSDTLGVFGIPDEIPPALQAWQMFEKAQAAQNPYLLEPSADDRARGAQVTAIDPPTPPRSMILADSPVMYDAQEGVARWGNSVVEGLRGSPHLPGAAEALLAELDKFRGAARYESGGPVSGPGGVDKVPAWLTAREFVVNELDANAGQHPAILAAMNAGAKFTVGQPNQGAVGRGNTTNIFNGIQDSEEVIRRLRVKEMQDAASHGWGPR